MLVRFLFSFSISYMTQRKSAITFVQGQSLNPYTVHYTQSFAFSFILYPPEDSAFVASDLLMIRLSSNPVGLTLLYRFKLSRCLDWIPILRIGVLFSRLSESEALNPTYLPFWSQPVRSHLAVCRITQFNQYLRLCSTFHLCPLAPRPV